MVRTTLENGLEVIVVSLPHLHSVSMAVLVRTGPRYETRDDNGISHMVEHLLFRGTRRHPSSLAFNSAVEALGSEVNGMTHRDATNVHIVSPPSQAVRALELLGDLVVRPTLSGIDVERNVVIEEILDTTDGEGCELDPDAISRQIMWKHPIGMPVAGTVQNVERLTTEDCARHYARTFVAKNAVLCIAGRADPQEMVEAAARTFGAMPSGARLDEGPSPVWVRGAPIHVQESEDSQISVLMSFPAPHENHPDFPTLLILRRLLDDGLASRLRQDICERRGLAYTVSGSMDVYSDVGAFDVEAHCSPQKLIRTVAQILATLRGLAFEGVPEAELARARARHEAELMFALDDAQEMGSWYGACALLGCAGDYEARREEALAVGADDVRRLARGIFDPQRALLTLVGPVEPEQAADLEVLFERDTDSTIWLNTEDEPTGTDEEGPALVVVAS